MFNLEYIRRAERFHALQLPIYYYVKTKGSLASQGLSISKTVKMKLTVFEYYHRFFKTVLDEEEYERSRLKVYRFLVDAAGDGVVPPLPSSRRLGSERVQVSPAGLVSQGCLGDAFRNRKLLESYLETAALKNDLTLSEALTLLALQQLDRPCTRRELADFVGLSRGTLALALQKLIGKGLLETDLDTDERQPVLTVEADPILRDLDAAVEDSQAAGLADFTEEELAQYRAFSARITDNIQKILQ